MKPMDSITTTLIMEMFGTDLSAAEPSTAPIQVAPLTLGARNDSRSKAASDKEIAVLRAQLEQVKRYDQHLPNAVQLRFGLRGHSIDSASS